MHIQAAALDISENSVKVLSLKQTKEGQVPEFFEERRIAPGIISDGGVQDPVALAKVLVALKRKCGIRFVRMALPEEKAYLFQTTVPRAENKTQLQNSIEFQLAEHVPLPPEEAIFDYDIVRERGGQVEVSVTVFPKKVIAQYQDVLRKAGITPVAFELEGQAIAHAVVPRGDERTYMIVDFGRARSGISIVKSGVVGFTSTIDVGGNELTRAIMKYFNVDEAEAQKIKNTKGLVRSPENEQVYDTLMNTVSALRDEINRHLVFWNNKDANQDPADKVGAVILCGGNAALKGLPEVLSAGLKMPVEVADVWRNAFTYEAHIPPMSYEEGLSYATAVGLALV